MLNTTKRRQLSLPPSEILIQIQVDREGHILPGTVTKWVISPFAPGRSLTKRQIMVEGKIALTFSGS